MQAIGIFGGTFDPIHYGHLRLAEEMADALSLREVRFIPTGQPPHRAAPHTSATHRLEMVRRAIAGNPRFTLDEREVRATRISYTVDTLTELRSEMGAQQPLCLLLGADAFLGLSNWHEWRRLFELAHIVVVRRLGTSLQHALPEALEQEVAPRWVQGNTLATAAPARGTPPDVHALQGARPLGGLGAAGTVSILEMTPLAISASMIRNLLTQQKSVRYLMPDTVCDYLQQQQLYKPEK